MKEKYDTSKDIDKDMSHTHDVVLTHMSEKNGIKQFGEWAVAAMIEEYQQLNDGPIPENPFLDQLIMRNWAVRIGRKHLRRRAW